MSALENGWGMRVGPSECGEIADGLEGGVRRWVRDGQRTGRLGRKARTVGPAMRSTHNREVVGALVAMCRVAAEEKGFFVWVEPGMIGEGFAAGAGGA